MTGKVEAIVVQIHTQMQAAHSIYFRAITFDPKDKTNFHIESADFRYQRILILRIYSPGYNFLFTMMQSHKENAEKYHTGIKSGERNSYVRHKSYINYFSKRYFIVFSAHKGFPNCFSRRTQK